MLTLDKKSILKEIEVLIRSIKVHYDNIENEHRIPTIELELITSKIRKLHEKSIIYNHLHYLEEETSLMQKRDRNLADVMDAMQIAERQTVSKVHQPPVIEAASASAEIPPSPIMESKETPQTNEAVITEPVVASASINQKAPVEAAPIAPVGEHQLKMMDLGPELGLNDRFWFINELFSGKGEELDLAINTFSNTPTHAEARNFLEHLVSRFKWNRDSEAFEHFIMLLNKRFGKI